MDNDKDIQAPQHAPDDQAAGTSAEKNYAQPSRDADGPLASASIRESVHEGLRQAKERAYAQDAVNATGRKIRPAGGPFGAFGGLRWQGEHYVTDQPVRAALIAAAGGAVLTALLIAFVRGGRR
jgi:hypothetical protein